VRHLKKENDVVMERHVLSRLDHPNVIRLFDTFRDDMCIYFVMEMCPDKELWELCRDVGLPTDVAFYYLTQILVALEYIHGEGIVHRDIKGENIMLSNGRAKLIDFGTAKDMKYLELLELDTKEVRRQTFVNYVGTPHFMAPEVIHNKHADAISDLYSVGGLIYQMFAGCPPFAAGSEYFIFLRVLDKDLLFPPLFPSNVRDVVWQLLDHDRDTRMTLSELKQSATLWGEGGDHSLFEEILHRPQPMLPLWWHCMKKLARLNPDEPMATPTDIPPEVLPRITHLQLVRQWDLEARPGHGPTPKLEKMMQESLSTPSSIIPLRPGKEHGFDVEESEDED